MEVGGGGSCKTRHGQDAAGFTKIESGPKKFGNCYYGIAIAATTGFTGTTVRKITAICPQWSAMVGWDKH